MQKAPLQALFALYNVEFWLARFARRSSVVLEIHHHRANLQLASHTPTRPSNDFKTLI
jgi:hypothetical protein